MMTSTVDDVRRGSRGSGRPRVATALRGLRTWWLCSPILAVLVLSCFWPLATIFSRSLNADGSGAWGASFTLDNYESLVRDDLLFHIARHTAYLAAASTAITVLLAFPSAYVMTRVSRGVSTILMVLVLIPFWTSILVRLFAFTAILGREGLVNRTLGNVELGPYQLMFNSQGTVIGMVAYLLPYMILILHAAMTGVDPSLTVAAHTMGASPRQAFWQIYFPQVRAAVVSGTTLIFVLALGFFLTPAILGGPRDLTIPMYIQQQISLYDWGRASAAGVTLLAVSLAGYVLALRLGGARILSMGGRSSGRGTAAAEPFRFTFSAGVCIGVLGLVLALLLVPLVVVVASAFGTTSQLRFPPQGFTLDWFTEVLQTSFWREPIAKSLRVAAATAVLATLLGLALARVGGQLRSATARTALQALALTPIVVPVILLGIGIFDVQTKLGLLGTEHGLVLAHVVICLPLTFLLLANAMGGVDAALEEAAWTMGVSRRRAFWTVVIPNVRPALVGSLLISFMTSWDEAVISLFQVGLEKTLPVTIFSLLRSGVTPAVAAVATLLIVPVVAGTLLASLVSSRRSSHPSRTKLGA